MDESYETHWLVQHLLSTCYMLSLAEDTAVDKTDQTFIDLTFPRSLGLPVCKMGTGTVPTPLGRTDQNTAGTQ